MGRKVIKNIERKRSNLRPQMPLPPIKKVIKWRAKN
jgi:hypothetical protein